MIGKNIIESIHKNNQTSVCINNHIHVHAQTQERWKDEMEMKDETDRMGMKLLKLLIR